MAKNKNKKAGLVRAGGLSAWNVAQEHQAQQGSCRAEGSRSRRADVMHDTPPDLTESERCARIQPSSQKW